MDPELCINIWFVADIRTQLCYNWSIKAYNLQGNDDLKLKILKFLAESDYVTAERNNFPDNIQVVLPDKTLKGKLPINSIQSHLNINLDYFVRYAEQHLPQQVHFNGAIGDGHQAIDQKIPEKPLFVSTVLMENEYGMMRPATTEENLLWIENEKNRIS